MCWSPCAPGAPALAARPTPQPTPQHRHVIATSVGEFGKESQSLSTTGPERAMLDSARHATLIRTDWRSGRATRLSPRQPEPLGSAPEGPRVTPTLKEGRGTHGGVQPFDATTGNYITHQLGQQSAERGVRVSPPDMIGHAGDVARRGAGRFSLGSSTHRQRGELHLAAHQRVRLTPSPVGAKLCFHSAARWHEPPDSGIWGVLTPANMCVWNWACFMRLLGSAAHDEEPSASGGRWSTGR
jgi:hypothetical protein